MIRLSLATERLNSCSQLRHWGAETTEMPGTCSQGTPAPQASSDVGCGTSSASPLSSDPATVAAVCRVGTTAVFKPVISSTSCSWHQNTSPAGLRPCRCFLEGADGTENSKLFLWVSVRLAAFLCRSPRLKPQRRLLVRGGNADGRNPFPPAPHLQRKRPGGYRISAGLSAARRHLCRGGTYPHHGHARATGAHSPHRGSAWAAPHGAGPLFHMQGVKQKKFTPPLSLEL